MYGFIRMSFCFPTVLDNWNFKRFTRFGVLAGPYLEMNCSGPGNVNANQVWHFPIRASEFLYKLSSGPVLLLMIT